MHIKTTDGETRSVASQGLGVTGTVLGGVALASVLSNNNGGGILGGFLGNNNRTSAVADIDTRIIAEKDAIIAYYKGKDYTDQVAKELFTDYTNRLAAEKDRVNGRFETIFTELVASRERQLEQNGEFKMEIALNKQKGESTAVALNEKINCNEAKADAKFLAGDLVLDSSKICGDVTACGTGFCTTGTSCTVPLAVQTVK